MTSNPFGQFAEVETRESDEGGLDLRRYLHAVNRYKWALIALVLISGAAAWFYANTLTPIYRATASIVLQLDPPRLVSVEQIYTGRGESIRTQLLILQSRDLAEEVVRRLELDKNPAFIADEEPGLFSPARWLPFGGNEAPTQLNEEQAFNRAVGRVRSGLSVNAVDGTMMVRLNFESPHRALAVDVVNTFGEVYIDSGMEARVAGTERASDWLTERLERLRLSLQESEARLQAYREEQGLALAAAATGDEGVVRAAADDVEELRRAMIAEGRTLDEIERTLSLIRSVPREAWSTLSAVTSRESLRDLVTARSEAEREIANLSQRYGPKHPRMIQAQGRFEEIEQSLNSRVAALERSLQEEAEQARATQLALQQQVTEAEQRVQGIQRQRFDLTRLQRDVQANQRLYDMFLERMKETNQASIEEPIARFAERARHAAGPVAPRKDRIVNMAIALSLMLGVGLIVLRENLDNTFKNPDELAEATQAQNLGVLPDVGSSSKTKRATTLLFNADDQGGFAEAIRTLRTSVVLTGLDDPPKVIVVTSALPGEGKTTVASNLALAMSRLERVLLIDADMRRPSIAGEFGLSTRHGGVSEVIAAQDKLESRLHKHSDSMDVLPSGMVPPNPLELLSSKRFSVLLDVVRKRYDRIIIDTAPVHAVSDALMLSKISDGLIFVVRSDSTSRDVVQMSMRRLRQAQVPLMGTVLNRVAVSKSGYYGYGGAYGYGGYHSYHSYSSDREEKA